MSDKKGKPLKRKQIKNADVNTTLEIEGLNNKNEMKNMEKKKKSN